MDRPSVTARGFAARVFCDIANEIMASVSGSMPSARTWSARFRKTSAEDCWSGVGAGPRRIRFWRGYLEA